MEPDERVGYREAFGRNTLQSALLLASIRGP
jgi:hypothetical protein